MANERQQDAGTGDSDAERHLLARVHARDMGAFERLYRLHHPRLSRFVGSLVRRTALIDEVVNDTMMVLWDRSETFAGNSRLTTWLFAIAYRKASRARARDDPPVDDAVLARLADESALTDGSLAHARSAALLRAAVEQLSADHRAVVHLTYYQEMSYRDIADILECPIDTVKTRMFHARRHLRRHLAGDLADWL